MKKIIIIIAWVAVAVLALQLRTVGLYRGLDSGYIYNPDEPKQVVTLWRYMRGVYVWRVGSLFYDGYPYGLNCLDAIILTPLSKVSHAVVGHVAPNPEREELPDEGRLFYLARTLRVFYSLFALLFCVLSARRLKFSGIWMWLMALLMALAPVSVAVTHSASGDVGTDLFASLMLYFLCLFADRNRLIWLWLAGLAVGMAFACKYNGLLAGGAVGVYLVCLLLGSRDWRWFARSCAVLVAGVLMGIVALTPTLLMDWDNASSDIIANFKFIRSFGAGEWWEEMSLAGKASFVLAGNLPRILSHLGWLIVAPALAGLIFSGRKAVCVVKQDKVDSESRLTLAAFAIFTFPFIALAISLAGKPEFQPFHFSYLQFPFVMASVYGLRQLSMRSKGHVARLAVIVLAAVSVCELAATSRRDVFFWARQDNNSILKQTARVIFTDEGRFEGEKGELQDVVLEPEAASVFRNRARTIKVYGAEIWRDMQRAPVSSVPYPVEQEWIFAEGPSFPRDAGMYMVQGDSLKERYIVFYGEPSEITLGLRSGSWPVEVRVSAGGSGQTVRLKPDSQTILAISPDKSMKVKMGLEYERNVYIVPISVEALVGDVYVTACFDEKDRRNFEVFGGAAEPGKAIMPDGVDLEVLKREVMRTAYLESGPIDGVELDASERDNKECIFPAPGQHRPISMPLACGRYVFECDVEVASESAEVSLQFADARWPHGIGRAANTFKLKAGANRITYRFDKKFAPYQACILMTCLDGSLTAGEWTVRPDSDVMIEALSAWEKGGARPSWLETGKMESVTYDDENPSHIMFGGAFKLTRIVLQDKLSGKDTLKVRCALDMVKYPFRGFNEHYVFLHWIDAEGKQAFADGFAVSRAIGCNTSSGVEGIELDFGRPEALKEGEYTLEMGVWNSRTGKRLAVSGPDAGREDGNKRIICIGNLKITK